ncbi:amidase domain-containing protein [Cryobacterium sp. HLT2-28]|uniref:amidase domain-containing protein n=1 Tax=Cryobacterium sp. HLT2-28 TaxID=1259146 RepID=UPI00106B41E8|nr:amidase domain-containing protein [Cryobacterium sp. HLT2-28]TFB99114.1 CHAP domain-containing protein [Cryobacterium sp. HLT2-28]
MEKPARPRHVVLAGSAAAACAAVAISVGFATGGSAIGASAPSPTRAVPAAAAPAAPVEQPKPVVHSSISAPDGASVGPVTGGTTVTVSGDDLAGVASVTFGGNAGAVVSATESTVTITTPPATDLGTGPVAVELFDAAGTTVPVNAAGAGVSDSAAAAAGSAVASVPAPGSAAPSAPVRTAPAPSPAAAPAAGGTASLTFNYVPDPRVTAQTTYALAHWDDYNTDDYGSIGGNDCVNFTSQTLVARGWTMDAGWSFDTDSLKYSPAWASSTAFAAYLAAHPERATPLTDKQRNLVKVGDIVQFDWDDSGDEDHTGIVTRVEKSGQTARIYYAGHTSNTDYQSVDESLRNGGGTVSFWSVK